MDYYCPEWVADSRPAKGRRVPSCQKQRHVVLPLFSRIPVWAEGEVGKLWRFDCPECEGMGRDLGRIIPSPNPWVCVCSYPSRTTG